MAHVKDLSGQKFGSLEVLDKFETRLSGKRKKAYWLCKCVCGEEKFIRGSSLVNGCTTSCGCQKNDKISIKQKEVYRNKKQKFRVDHSGEKFGYLTILDKYKRVKSGKNTVGLWLCECICGKKVWKQYSSLKFGVKSCGCMTSKMQSDSKKLSDGEAAMNRRYGQYKIRAKRKNLSFSISKKFFKDITCQPCHYCGIEPSNEYVTPDKNGTFVYNGIDRLDNARGYVKENCVPCCKICNRAKDIMTKKAFEEWVTRVYNMIEGVAK